MSRKIGPHIQFLLYWAVSLVLFYSPLKALVDLSLRDDRYSQLVFIPLISLFLVWFERDRIFADVQYCPRLGAPILGGALLLYFAGSFLSGGTGLAVAVLAMALAWMAGFVLCYGPRCLKAAAFPWCFLLLLVPLPEAQVEMVIATLQRGSAELTFHLFRLAGVPVFRQGYTFSLPGVNIEVARECSSIRSGTALFITGLLASHMFLRAGWRKACLVLLTPAIAMCTNAVRIVTLSSLSVYVDRGFLNSSLHHRGGALFSVLSMAALTMVIFVLRRTEHDSRPRSFPVVSDCRQSESTVSCPR